MSTTRLCTAHAPPYRPAPIEMRGGASRLYRDYLDGRTQLAGYYGPRFDDEAALGALAEQLQARPYAREQLTASLAAFAAETEAPEQARAQLELLRRPQSLTVFAGQQPGLFTGPLYTVYKALTAERWASELSQRLSMPVVACFWLADDDHDLAEVDHIHLPCRGRIATLRYSPTARQSGAAIGRVVADAGMPQLLDSLAECLPDSQFKPTVIEALAECYAPGSSTSVAFARLWYRLFPRSRLLFVSALHSGLYRLAMPIFQRAIDDSAQLYDRYARSSRQLEAAGYHRQVHKPAERTFLFHQGAAREAICRDASGSSYRAGAIVWSPAQLHQAIAADPQEYSPNVLLRPLVQNSLFPTVGVVLGPAEIAYYAQLGALHDLFAVPRPAILPRSSVTLLEPRMARDLARHAIDLAHLARHPDAEVARILRARLPADLHNALQRSSQAMAGAFDPLRNAVGRIDPTLEAAVEAAAVRAHRALDQVGRKLHAAHRRREQELTRQIQQVAARLFPRGKPQERTHNIVYYWARFGPVLLRELHEHMPAGRLDPLIWPLHDEGP